MKLETFPYRFRGKANAEELQRRVSGIVELKGAKALYDLYVSGASFRLMPDSPVDAVVFDLDELTADDANILDRYAAGNAFVVKSPSAVLGIPGKENRRKVIYALSHEHPYAEYTEAYGNAFAQFVLEAGIGAMTCDPYMTSPGQIIFGRPDPDMETPVLKLDISGLGNMRVPMPMCRRDARELFGIDARIKLPAVEYFATRKPSKEECREFIWKKIIPAAFAWFRFFETTKETRWGLPENGFEFKDCLRAIWRELGRLEIGGKEAEEVIRGDLYSAYARFETPRMTIYIPRSHSGLSKWDKASPMQKKETYARHSAWAKAKRRRLAIGREETRGRKPVLVINTLDDLETLWALGEISKPYYYRKRAELAKKRGGRPE